MIRNSQPVIAIIDDYEMFTPELTALATLREALPKAEIRVISAQPLNATELNQLADVHYLVLIRERTQVTPAILEKMPALKAIVQTGRFTSGSVSPEVVKTCQRRNIDLLEGGRSDGYSTAELTWALILVARRHLHAYMSSMQAGHWQQGSEAPALGQSLRGQTLGILGYGRIGQLLANYGRAFGMDIAVWGRDTTRQKAKADNIHVCSSQQDLFASSDIVTLHLRLTDETRHSITDNDLHVMKPGSLLVNTARAELMAPGTLEKGLARHTPAMAAIDVYEDEPLTELGRYDLPNLITTPHIGYVERHSYEVLFEGAFQQLIGHAQNAFSPSSAI